MEYRKGFLASDLWFDDEDDPEPEPEPREPVWVRTRRGTWYLYHPDRPGPKEPKNRAPSVKRNRLTKKTARELTSALGFEPHDMAQAEAHMARNDLRFVEKGCPTDHWKKELGQWMGSGEKPEARGESPLAVANRKNREGPPLDINEIDRQLHA